ncbi:MULTISPECIES: DUF5702 domain-containing protein [unclassified Virgibacillus]|uniref:DUF5702 domain-containing protein n=1 Tax=unclassified Virgibacillus TaxID=2620237 RepID=UPI0024DEB7B8|nr:DUF5702 domain-containing protein [Virgibacillus sp. LDC-1]
MFRILKNLYHRFLIDERGAVSIYLIIVTLLLFLFNAVLIDYARIIIAERQTEEAAKTALRSTLSSYNSELQNRGLFAFSGDQAEANSIFKEVFRKNLETGKDSFNFLGLQPVEDELSLDLNMERSLANKDILKYQILEEMKYKAPIEVGEALIRDFLTVAEHVEEASDYAKIAKKVNKKAKEREELLDEVETLLTDAKALLEKMEGNIQHNTSSSYPEVTNISDILQWHNKYIEDLKAIKEYEDKQNDNNNGNDDNKKDKEKEEEEKKEIEKKRKNTKQFKANALALLDELITTSKSAVLKLEEALPLIEEAEELNDEIESTINKHKEEGSSSDYENAKQVSKELENSNTEENLEGTLDDYILDKALFTELKEEVTEAIQSLKKESGDIQTNALIPKLERDFKGAVEQDFEGSNKKGSIVNHVKHAKQYHKDALESTTNAYDILKNNEGRKKYKENEEEIEKEEEKADEDMEETKNKMDDIQEAIDNAAGAASDMEKYASLREKVTKYGEAIEANNEEFVMEDRDDTADQALGFVDKLFKNIGDTLINARDEVYINEYILMRFKSHDFSMNGVEANLFENNQVEYIIYGLHAHGANYYAALSEIFAVRFAINLAAGFLQPKAKGFGPFIWAYALGYAFGRTAADMNNIIKGKQVKLFPVNLSKKGIMPKMDYRDHLRLFLFTHLEGAKFERLMGVLDDETSTDLTESSTYVSANATATVKLWFLPGVMKIIESTNTIGGRVEGNRFFIEKEINLSY